jgi:F-type H+-transporting ATPase subunit delta
MSATAVAHKYAKALFAEARERERIDRVAADLVSLAALEQEDRSFHDFLVSPEVLTEHKQRFLETVFRPRMDPLSVDFLRLVVEKGRIDILPLIWGEFQLLVEEHRGMLKAEVLSAVALSGEQESRLKMQLDRLTGKNVVLKKTIDPGVLGGVVVHLGNQILDGSLRQGLEEIRRRLLVVEVN